MSGNLIKSISLDPTEVLAGDTEEFTVKILTGKDFSTNHSKIVFDMPGYLGYSRPSTLGQEAPGYVEVFCSNPNIKYKKDIWNIETDKYGETSNENMFMGLSKRFFVLELVSGEFKEDDEILVKWGYNRDNFSVGVNITTLVLEKEFFNSIDVRYFIDGGKALPDMGRSYIGHTRPVPDFEKKLKFLVKPRSPKSIRVIRRINETNIQVLDKYKNISRFSHFHNREDIDNLLNTTDEVHENSMGVLVSEKNCEVTSKTLPVSYSPFVDKVFEDYNIYFGDLHIHSMISNDCIERERQEMTPEKTYIYGRDTACLDFMAITDHHQPWDIERNKIGEENWSKLLSAADDFNKDNKFIAFQGFEFRDSRGDAQIILNEKLSYEVINDLEITDISALWNRLKGYDFISIPHFHNPGKSNIPWIAPIHETVEPVMEIYSCHGSFENTDVLERRPPEMYDSKSREIRNGKYMLDLGLKYGHICNSDGHKGNPGRNGLTAIFAKELTRESVLEAIRDRRCYGTSNARIKLVFLANGELMGRTIKNTSTKNFKIFAEGENNLKSVDILKNGEIFHRYEPNTIKYENNIQINDADKAYWYVRVTQTDNHIAYSSPVWFE